MHTEIIDEIYTMEMDDGICKLWMIAEMCTMEMINEIVQWR